MVHLPKRIMCITLSNLLSCTQIYSKKLYQYYTLKFPAPLKAISPFINKVFTGLSTDPSTGNIYAGFTPSLKQAGYVFRYQSNGTLIDSVKVGIGPEGFLFK